MPVEVESASQVEDFLRVLRVRNWAVVVPFIVLSALGSSFAILVPKKYVAREEVMVRQMGGRDRKSLGSAGGQVAAHMLTAPKRVKAVIEALRWPWATLTREEQQVLLKRTIGNLTVTSPPFGPGVTEQVVRISFAHTDPAKALVFTQELSERWREEVLDASRKATEQAFGKLKERRGQMQRRLDQISETISEKHREYGIPPWDTVSWGERPLAREFRELPVLRESRQALAEAIFSQNLERSRAEQVYSKMDDLIPFESTQEGLNYAKNIQELRDSVLTQQLLLETQGYKPSHSEYSKIQSRIRGYREEMTYLEEAQSRTVTSGEMRENQAKLEVGEALARMDEDLAADVSRIEALDGRIQKTAARTKELQAVYQELHDLQAERARTNSNLAQVEDEFTRMDVLWTEVKSSAGNPFFVTEDAELPTVPTEPSAILIIIGSMVLGLAMGLGLAALGEYGRNCFRSVNEITRVMVVPVLGTVNQIVTGRQRRRRTYLRLFVGSAVVLLVGTLGFLTYAWEYNHALLSDDLRESIASFRRAFE